MAQESNAQLVSTSTAKSETPAIPAAGIPAPQPSSVDPNTSSTEELPSAEGEVKPLVDETPHSTRKQALERLRKEAETEVQGHLTLNRVEHHRLKRELDGLPGKEDYAAALLQVVQSYGKEGVHASELHESFPDGKKLTEARKNLVEAKSITAEKKANSWLLKAGS